MNPLNHFGIRTRMIRGDTSSYNSVKNVGCSNCNKTPSMLLEYDDHNNPVFMCKDCMGKYTMPPGLTPEQLKFAGLKRVK